MVKAIERIRRQRQGTIGDRSRGTSLTFDELYEDWSDHWEDKAKRLQDRRWKYIREHSTV
jgi:hypothetical protein